MSVISGKYNHEINSCSFQEIQGQTKNTWFFFTSLNQENTEQAFYFPKINILNYWALFKFFYTLPWKPQEDVNFFFFNIKIFASVSFMKQIIEFHWHN